MNQGSSVDTRRGLGCLATALVVSALAAGACTDATSPDPGGGGGGAAQPYDHLRAPGASAHDLLSGDAFDRLVVQVQYAGGYPPSAEGLQALEDFLGARLRKPGGITVLAPEPIEFTRQATYSASDIRAIEASHRTVYTEGTTLAAYFLFVDGELDGGPNVLGIAYNNTSMAIFEQKVVDHTGGLGQPSRTTVEATVAEHEFGHILGLVNAGSAMQVDHQDDPNGHHCDNPDCLMYYAVRTTDFLANLTGGTVPQLDQNCLNDLQANGGT